MNKWLVSPLTTEQVEAVEVLTKYVRFLLNYGTGLGKTYAALASFSWLLEADPSYHFVAVCPKSATISWKKELKERTRYNWRVFHTFEKDRDKILSNKVIDWQVTVLTYPAITKFPGFMENLFQNHRIILCIDEAHRIKNPNAAITKVVCSYIKRANSAWGMTATMLLNKLEDLWGIFEAFFPGYLGSKESFLCNYTIRKERNIRGKKTVRYNGVSQVVTQCRKILEIVGYKNLDKLRERIDPLFLRRMRDFNIKFYRDKAKITPQEEEKYLVAAEGLLMSKKEKDFSARLPDLQLVVDNAVDDYKVENRDLELSSKETVLFHRLNSILREGGGAIVYNCLKVGISRLMFILKQYKHVLQFEKLFMITGDVDIEVREKIVKNHGSGTILVMTEAGGQSINLQQLNNVVFYNVPFSLGWFIQIVGRIARMDSLFEVFNVFMIELETTIDTYKVEKIMHHSGLIDKVISGEGNIPKGQLLSSHELRSMRKSLLWRIGQWQKTKN